MQLDEMTDEDRYRVAGFSGVAFAFYGPQVERYWDLDEGIDWTEPEERPTGLALMVMVGDDTRHAIDPDDVTVIADEDYCGSCGQIGCGWS